MHKLRACGHTTRAQTENAVLYSFFLMIKSGGATGKSMFQQSDSMFNLSKFMYMSTKVYLAVSVTDNEWVDSSILPSFPL